MTDTRLSRRDSMLLAGAAGVGAALVIARLILSGP
jgi:hypothetical protein